MCCVVVVVVDQGAAAVGCVRVVRVMGTMGTLLYPGASLAYLALKFLSGQNTRNTKLKSHDVQQKNTTTLTKILAFFCTKSRYLHASTNTRLETGIYTRKMLTLTLNCTNIVVFWQRK